MLAPSYFVSSLLLSRPDHASTLGVHDDKELGKVLNNPESINFGPFAKLCTSFFSPK